MRRMLCTALAAGIALSMSGCGGSGDASDPVSSASAPSAPASASGLSAADRAGFVAALRKVDPGLVVNEERAVRRGRDTCLDIRQGMEGAKLVDRVSQRFTGGNATVDEAKARKVIAAVKRWVC